MRQFSFACMLGYACVMAVPAYAWTHSEISVVAGLQNFVIDSGVDSGEVKILTDKTTHAIQFVNGKPHLVPADAPSSPVAPPNILPHAAVTQGERNIASAWLATATDRYNHGVLGDEIGAATAATRLQNGDVLRYDLPADSVFEDLTPRLYDIDGDGDDEIIVVRSNLYDGAAVSVLTVGATGLEVFAEAYPIGLAHRWISPLDAAEFDGDGVMEVAAMVAPHLQGVPSFYNREGQRLKRFAAAPGFSTYYIDSSILGMSVILDAHSDGRPGIVLPSLDRDTLYTVGFDDPSKLKIIETVHHDSEIMTAIAATDIDRQGGADIMYGLDSGAIILIRR